MQKYAALPNAITLASAASASTGLLYLGWTATERALAVAMLCLALSLLCDVLDGKLARALGVSSPLGAQLDSLADLLAFGLLPAFAMGKVLNPAGTPSWGVALPCLAFILAATLRLARYSQQGLIRNRFGECFQGLPSSVAAILLMTGVMAHQWLQQHGPWPDLALSGLALALAVAMNLSFPFPKRGIGFYPWLALVPGLLVNAWCRTLAAGL
ncbi:MAG TPA: CDP-alcohol phosphatidyltransferase family protein [Burkholderiaceae bacterium]|nr:CDP-alcohol phosphatidyltransferase family protein [Burkholderiaceae bacterium]